MMLSVPHQELHVSAVQSTNSSKATKKVTNKLKHLTTLEM
jgi:hypothetical protein